MNRPHDSPRTPLRPPDRARSPAVWALSVGGGMAGQAGVSSTATPWWLIKLTNVVRSSRGSHPPPAPPAAQMRLNISVSAARRSLAWLSAHQRDRGRHGRWVRLSRGEHPGMRGGRYLRCPWCLWCVPVAGRNHGDGALPWSGERPEITRVCGVPRPAARFAPFIPLHAEPDTGCPGRRDCPPASFVRPGCPGTMPASSPRSRFMIACS
jgi:hypothetical protein